MKKPTSWLANGSLLALMALVPTAANAADDQAREDTTPPTVEEIIVTAQFREQRLQDTPLAITAMPAQLLEARSQTSILDLGAFAPNVNLTQSTALNGNSITAYIRGIGQDDASFALEPGVGIYLDDVYYGTTFGAVLDLVDLDRVEVLRGPQGTLAGKNSLGGAVKLFAAKPNADLGGSIEAGTGRYNRINLRGSLNLPLADGVYARVSGTYDKRDGYFRLLDYGCANPGSGVTSQTTASDCVTGTQGGLDVLSLRGALRYAPAGSQLDVTITADYARNNSEPPATKLTLANHAAIAPALSLQDYRTYAAGNPFGGVPFDSRFLTAPNSYSSYENYAGSGNYTTIFGFPAQVAPGTFTDIPENSTESWGVTGTADLTLNDDLALKSITAYRKTTGYSVLEVDGSPISILKEGLRNSHRQFTQELRLTGKIGTLADFTVGGFYYKAEDRAFQRIMIPVFQY
ncbi:MAG: TonB-dependent receptor plug domain-containing protein, partial [Novosphingobium sp.]